MKLNYVNVTKVFEKRITELKTLPKADMRFAKPSDYSELARNNESAWQLYLLWRELCEKQRTIEDEQRLMALVTK